MIIELDLYLIATFAYRRQLLNLDNILKNDNDELWSEWEAIKHLVHSRFSSTIASVTDNVVSSKGKL